MIEYLAKPDFLNRIFASADNSFNALIIVTGALDLDSRTEIINLLEQGIRVLKQGGLLFVQGYPSYLPDIGVFLDERLNFKYWIAVKSLENTSSNGLPSSHAAVLLFTKGNGNFKINPVRFPHEYCAHCDRTLRDWGGKAHLMNPAGYAASDVWSNLPIADNYSHLSEDVLDSIIKMIPGESILIGPYVKSSPSEVSISDTAFQLYLPSFGLEKDYPRRKHNLPDNLLNVVHSGDAVDILRQYPANSIDLVFADPPYNLSKDYSIYDDNHSRKEYLSWCNSWLEEYVRILKPTGSLYLLNLPRWTMYHAAFLNKKLFFQNWIVWDAMSEPRGKIMPAHYGLLFYTKQPSGFTFNYQQMGEIDSRRYCLRASCIRERKLLGDNKKEPLTDIWSDIHRLKHRRDRDYHPCQLPDTLMERIIRLSTNEGDVVLDALAGTGTTAVVARRLGRRYVAIDVDEAYVRIIEKKLAQVENLGYVRRQSIHRPRLPYSKKVLQLELQRIASELGYLPTPEDVKTKSKYELDAFLETFPTWGKALKAAKIEVRRNKDASS